MPETAIADSLGPVSGSPEPALAPESTLAPEPALAAMYIKVYLQKLWQISIGTKKAPEQLSE